jgi:DNA-directed RNA polymerase subunit F
VQTADIRAELLMELKYFLEEQKSILLDLASNPERKGDAQQLFSASEKQKRGETLDDIIETLRRYTN